MEKNCVPSLHDVLASRPKGWLLLKTKLFTMCTYYIFTHSNKHFQHGYSVAIEWKRFMNTLWHFTMFNIAFKYSTNINRYLPYSTWCNVGVLWYSRGYNIHINFKIETGWGLCDKYLHHYMYLLQNSCMVSSDSYCIVNLWAPIYNVLFAQILSFKAVQYSRSSNTEILNQWVQGIYYLL